MRRKALTEPSAAMRWFLERISAHTNALSRIEADTETFRAELRAAEVALDGLSDTSALERRRDDVQADLADARGHAAETRLAAERAVHQETVRVRRLADIAAERVRWTQRIKKADERVCRAHGAARGA